MLKNLVLVFQFGLTMLVPILLCSFIGISLDRLLGTTFIVVILFFVGALAGFRNIFIMAKKSTGKVSYIGTDVEKRLNDGTYSDRKADIFERIDRAHRENMNNEET